MAEGHRGRHRDRFREENIDTIPEYAVLEMILHGVIVRRDAGAQARGLINEFGSLAKVIDATPQELQKVKGVGKEISSFLTLLPSVYKRYCQSKAESGMLFENIQTTGEYLRDCCMAQNKEVVFAMFLTSDSRLVSCKMLDLPFHSPLLNVREIVDYAVASNASRVVVAHNHLDGEAMVSDEDIMKTKLIYNALRYVNVFFEDHIIVYKNEFVSMSMENKMPKSMFKK